jgi:hypothetical protein
VTVIFAESKSPYLFPRLGTSNGWRRPCQATRDEGGFVTLSNLEKCKERECNDNKCK